MDFSVGFVDLGVVAVPLWVGGGGSAATEWFLASGFWFRQIRIWAAAVGVGFHVYLKFVVAIGGLDHLAMAMYLLFFVPIEARRDEETLVD